MIFADRSLLELSDAVAFDARGIGLADLASPDLHTDSVYITLACEWLIIM